MGKNDLVKGVDYDDEEGRKELKIMTMTVHEYKKLVKYFFCYATPKYLPQSQGVNVFL
jgi:hypothetical protein